MINPIDTVLFWKNMGERALKTFLQNFLVALAAVQVLGEFDWKAALSAAALATVMTALMAVLDAPFPGTGNPTIDLFERALKTFVGSLASSLTVYTGVLDVPWQTVLGLALITTAGSLATSLGGQLTRGTASLVKS